MSSHSRRNQIRLVRHLADALFDGSIRSEEVRELEQLITDDFSCLQAYIERCDIHSELILLADRRSDLEAAVLVLQEFTQACELQEQRRRRTGWLTIAASVLLFIGGGSWVVLTDALRPRVLGTISGLTAGHHSSQPLELGQPVRKGEMLTVQAGLVCVQLPHVMLDLVGPASVEFHAADQVTLHEGTIGALIYPGGEGFVVRTADAEVVDLGTELMVSFSRALGTEVAVRRGRAEAGFLAGGAPQRTLELGAGQAARVDAAQGRFRQIVYQAEKFLPFDRTRGCIRSLKGSVRTLAHLPESLESEKTITPNHMLVIPEQQNVLLKSPFTVDTAQGRITLPAGSLVSSYLIHYDPTELVSRAPRGAISFSGVIAGCITSADSLSATDQLFGLPDTIYESRPFRGLELDADEIQLSEDRRTASFYFGMAPPEYLDQVRLLVIQE